MMKFKSFIALAALVCVTALPVSAQKGRRGDAEDVFNATKGGAIRSLRSIENGIVPAMKSRGADYIGAEYIGEEARYRLKFMRGSSVIWIDVDGKSGAVVGKAGE
jgi:hypothetical protein